MFNLVRYILSPLLVGLLLGAIGGEVSIYGSKLIALKLSQKQETIAFWGFTIWFGFGGLLDSINRFLHWLKTRNPQ